jgi:hypothetical protein
MLQSPSSSLHPTTMSSDSESNNTADTLFQSIVKVSTSKKKEV